MTAEVIGILTVGVAIAALILTSTGRLRSELGARIGALEDRFGALEQRMAWLKGLFEGAGLYRPAAAWPNSGLPPGRHNPPQATNTHHQEPLAAGAKELALV